MTIKLRRDTAANWSSVNPVLAAGEQGWDTTNRIMKIGDGTTAWNSLAALTPKITVSTSAPGSPAVNDLWVDTN